MCEHCKTNKTWAVVLEKGHEQNCQWTRYYEAAPAREDSEDCLQPATQRVYHQYVLAHLCKDHMWNSMKEDKERESNYDSKSKYLPIKEAKCRCLAIHELPTLPKQETGEKYDFDGIIRCGLPATHAKVVLEESCFCDEHTHRYMTQEDQSNLDSLPGRFAYKEELIPLSETANMVVCARKGCGKTADGNIDSLPEGWRVIVMARGSLFKPVNPMTADWDGVLCPKHFQEINNMLVNLPFKAF